MIHIELTENDANAFKNFMRYRLIFDALMDAKVFDTHNGQVTINFNHLGKMMNIEVKTQVYRSVDLQENVDKIMETIYDDNERQEKARIALTRR